jgi:hypothetical protein
LRPSPSEDDETPRSALRDDDEDLLAVVVVAFLPWCGWSETPDASHRPW